MINAAPLAQARPHTFQVGTTRWDDPFEWLRGDTRVQRTLLKAEANAAADTLRGLRPIADALLRLATPEMLAREFGPATRVRDAWLLPVLTPGARHPRLVKIDVADSPIAPNASQVLTNTVPHRILLDLDAELHGRNSAVGGVTLAPTGDLLAWSEDPDGSERFDIHVKDLSTDCELTVLHGMGPQVEFTSDGRQILTVALDPLNRPYRVERHDPRLLGYKVTVLEELDPTRRLRLRATRSGQFQLIESNARTHNRVWALRGDADLIPLDFLPHGTHATVEHARSRKRDWWAVLLRDDDHPNGELLLYPCDDPAHPLVIAGHRKDVTVAPPLVTEGRLIVSTVGPRTEVAMVDLNSDDLKTTCLAHCDGTLSLGTAPSWEADHVTVALPSYTRSPLKVELSMTPRTPGPVHLRADDLGPYREEHLTVPAAGVGIPLTVVTRRGCTTPGPLLLTAYGSYGTSRTTHHDPLLTALIDHGMTYAVAHVRGGGEKGRAWHDGGRVLNKPNALADLFSCLNHLEECGIAAPGNVALIGGSAGGTLMAAALNQAPERFCAAVLEAPFVDVLASMINPDLPLTASDRSEWGDPLTSEAVLACIRSYSPYENLTAQTYPPVLVVVRTHDTRVPPVQALKYAQRFRRNCSGGPLILLPEAGGHTGGTSLHNSLQAHALQLAWISVRLGLDLPQTPSESTISL